MSLAMSTHESPILVGPANSLPSIFAAQPQAKKRLRDFFSSHIRNPNSRAYMEAVRQFSGFCAELGILDLAQVEPVHVAAFVELQRKTQSKPTVRYGWRLSGCSSIGWWSLREGTDHVGRCCFRERDGNVGSGPRDDEPRLAGVVLYWLTS